MICGRWYCSYKINKILFEGEFSGTFTNAVNITATILKLKANVITETIRRTTMTVDRVTCTTTVLKSSSHTRT